MLFIAQPHVKKKNRVRSKSIIHKEDSNYELFVLVAFVMCNQKRRGVFPLIGFLGQGHG